MSIADSPTRFRLSKSKISAFEHCPRRLWLQIHQREAGQFEPETLKRFGIGHVVGEKAREAFHDGILVELEPDIASAIVRTRELLQRQPPVPIFEAAFQFEDVVIFADILEPDGAGGWRVLEVKASSRPRSYQIADLSTQVWTMLGCGVPVSSAYIRHLRGPINWANFDPQDAKFLDHDVTRAVGRYLRNRAQVVQAARRAVRGDEIRIEMGEHCERPFACEFERHCRLCRDLPLLGPLAGDA